MALRLKDMKTECILHCEWLLEHDGLFRQTFLNELFLKSVPLFFFLLSSTRSQRELVYEVTQTSLPQLGSSPFVNKPVSQGLTMPLPVLTTNGSVLPLLGNSNHISVSKTVPTTLQSCLCFKGLLSPSYDHLVVRSSFQVNVLSV